jgi:hypothetical protein
MAAFAAVLDALFADPNIGGEAIYPSEGGAAVLVRVVFRQADAITDFGNARLWSETTRIDLRVAKVTAPRPGARLEIDGDAFLIQGAPVRDRERLVWTVDGFWLAILLPAAGKSTLGGRITPGEWERRRGLRLRFVDRRTGPSLLVAEGRLNTKGQAVVSRLKTRRGKVTAPIFLLVPQVRLPKRLDLGLDLGRDAERALDSVPGLTVANWVETRF